MGQVKDYFAVMDRIEWFENCSQVPSWQNQGISHGFVGFYGRLPLVHGVKQVHGTTIVPVAEKHEATEADGISSDDLRCVAIKTADCLPVLMWSPQRVVAVHAGWRGLCHGIVRRGIQHLVEVGRPQQIRVAIGPAIGRRAFEVGPEVVKAFEESWDLQELAIASSKGVRDRWHLQLFGG